VDDAYRRRGIARALIERSKKLAHETSAKVMSLDTGRDNVSSHLLYEAMGFVRDDSFCTYILRL
jgi:GNAT superfamily N-acetyltransferase